MKIGVVVTNYNGRNDLLDCLKSIERAERTPSEIDVVVVDNGSSDGSTEMVKTCFPWVSVTQVKKNMGFGGGNNIGSEYLLDKGVDVIVMLNNDTVIAEDFFVNLSQTFHRYPGALALSPKIRMYGNPELIESTGYMVSMIIGAPWPRGYGERDIGQFDNEEYTSGISGPAIIVNRQLVDEIGLLDPAFFLGEEDTDYSLRIVKKNVPIVYAPSVLVFHKGHKSDKSRRKGYLPSPLGNYFSTRNSLRLLSIHGNLFQKIGHAYFLALVTVPWRILLTALSHRMVIRPLLWAVISSINPARVPRDDLMVERLFA